MKLLVTHCAWLSSSSKSNTTPALEGSGASCVEGSGAGCEEGSGARCVESSGAACEEGRAARCVGAFVDFGVP